MKKIFDYSKGNTQLLNLVCLHFMRRIISHEPKAEQNLRSILRNDFHRGKAIDPLLKVMSGRSTVVTNRFNNSTDSNASQDWLIAAQGRASYSIQR